MTDAGSTKDPGLPYITPADPGGARRPLWYRLAGYAEPLRPLFGWAVAHELFLLRVGFVLLAVFGGLVSALAGRWVGSALGDRRVRRRLGDGGHSV